MSRQVKTTDVMTLAEAAKYLRVSRLAIEQLLKQRAIPGQQINGQWRLLKSALDDWLCNRPILGSRDELLRQAGAFKDDPDLPRIRAAIYAARGRPEVDTGNDS